jgi:hypothetical protein
MTDTTIRTLARTYVEACDAYKAAYRVSINSDLSIEDRVDAQLAVDAASVAMCLARRALDEAQKVAA